MTKQHENGNDQRFIWTDGRRKHTYSTVNIDREQDTHNTLNAPNNALFWDAQRR